MKEEEERKREHFYPIEMLGSGIVMCRILAITGTAALVLYFMNLYLFAKLMAAGTMIGVVILLVLLIIEGYRDRNIYIKVKNENVDMK